MHHVRCEGTLASGLQGYNLWGKSRNIFFFKKTNLALLGSFLWKWDACTDTCVNIPFLQRLHVPFTHVS